MTEQIRTTHTDDTEGHIRHLAVGDTDDLEGHGRKEFGDSERDESDDTEGHTRHLAVDETDDVEGHNVRWPADTLPDDVSGHAIKFGAHAEQDESDDVEGHNVRWPADAERDEMDVQGHGRGNPAEETQPTQADDVQGHNSRWPADTHSDDAGGHIRLSADAERTGNDAEDVAGHLSPRATGVHNAVTGDDEGRIFPGGTHPAVGPFPADGHEDDGAVRGVGQLDSER